MAHPGDVLAHRANQLANDKQHASDAQAVARVIELYEAAILAFNNNVPRRDTTEKGAEIVRAGEHADREADACLALARHYFNHVRSIQEKGATAAS